MIDAARALFDHFDVKGVVTNVTVIDRSAERDVILIERDARSSLIAKRRRTPARSRRRPLVFANCTRRTPS